MPSLVMGIRKQESVEVSEEKPTSSQFAEVKYTRYANIEVDGESHQSFYDHTMIKEPEIPRLIHDTKEISGKKATLHSIRN